MSKENPGKAKGPHPHVGQCHELRRGPLKSPLYRRESALDEAEHEQQDDCAYRRGDELTQHPVGGEAEKSEQEPTEECADDTDDEVSDEAEPATFHDLAGQPAGSYSDQQKPEYAHCFSS